MSHEIDSHFRDTLHKSYIIIQHDFSPTITKICNNLLFIMRLKCIFLLKQFLQSRANKIYIFERFPQGTDKGNVTMRERK